MALAILIIFFTAAVIPFIFDKSKPVAFALIIILAGGINYYLFQFLPEVTQGIYITQENEWVDALNIHITFFLDGLSLFFALLISFLGFLVLLYALKYIKGYTHEGRFFGYLLFFMGSMLGVVLSANLISLFIFWELTSLSSFLLIGFTNKEEKSRHAARQALLVTAGGGLALMAGFIIINIITGSYQFQEIFTKKELIQNHPLVSGAVLLILAGSFTKSAQFPFHFWLPNAMAAPTPVSAYLHSATMVKAGVYLAFRFNPVFQDVELWGTLLMLFGGATMIFAAYKAFIADDLKRILAFTTISALSIFFMMIGIGTAQAINAALLYVLAHAFYKGGLFMVAGNVDHEAGTRLASKLSGLGKKMPFTAFAAIATCLSMAGIIPALGFVGKEMLYEALLHQPQDLILFILLIVSSSFFTVVTILIGYKVFFAKTKNPLDSVHETPPLMYLPPVILGVLTLILGILPGKTIESLLIVSSENVFGTITDMHLKVWHGFNLVFWLSLGTIMLGFIFYFLRRYFLGFKQKFNLSDYLSADKFYNEVIKGTSSIATIQTNFFQNGYLRKYIAIFITLFSVLVIYLLAGQNFGDLIIKDILEGLGIFEVAILLLAIIAIIILFNTESRLIVVATLSIIGYGLAIAYAIFSAPDVAMTQFLAETLTLILLIIILHRLPKYVVSQYKVGAKYLIFSILFGLLMTGISLTMLSREIDSDLKRYFLEQSIPKGKGENVVNVILVDFRALDTMGEITVLGITMLGILSLLKFKSNQPEL
ncbi:MAG: hydrogen gas-evolving membrane-bound hydrogenase subunit E [Candidatus Cyclobacteriaceae bacterium M3_2C_046]